MGNYAEQLLELEQIFTLLPPRKRNLIKLSGISVKNLEGSWLGGMAEQVLEQRLLETNSKKA